VIVAAVPALRLTRRFGTSLRGGEEKALAAVAANRNNPTFKNRRNPKETKQKTFSNRNKNTCFGLPYFRYEKERSPAEAPSAKVAHPWPSASPEARLNDTQDRLPTAGRR